MPAVDRIDNRRGTIYYVNRPGISPSGESVMSHAAIAFVVGTLFLVLAGVFGWMASQSRKMFTNAAKEIAKDIRENTVAVKRTHRQDGALAQQA